MKRRARMAGLQQVSVAMALAGLALAPPSRAFAPKSLCDRGRPTSTLLRQHVVSAFRFTRSRRSAPRPLLASAKHDIKDAGSVIAEMEEWARVINPETYAYMRRNFQYTVSAGTSLPEVLFDFWKAISGIVDAHRATREDRSLRRQIMFVAPFCEELRDYETMEHVHQLLQQSARDGGCEDFGKAITHLHYHPNYRYRPRPKETRLASRHSPHPAFSIEVLYRTGGRKSLASMRAATGDGSSSSSGSGSGKQSARPSTPPARPPPGASGEGGSERVRRKKDAWVASTRSTLEHIYRTAASYGAEDVVVGTRYTSPHLLAGKGVPESSQEVLESTQAWMRGVLKDAAESDAAAATVRKSTSARRYSAPAASASSPPARSAIASAPSVSLGNLAGDRSTAFSPPTATETAAAAEAAEADAVGASGDVSVAARVMDAHAPRGSGKRAVETQHSTRPRSTSGAGGVLKQAFSPASEGGTVREETRRSGTVREQEQMSSACRQRETETGTNAAPLDSDGDKNALMPGKELVKRMRNISQYVVARSETAEEAFGDIWEVISEMADRAAVRGCSVPTEDYTSSSAPCYGALVVTPDLATYSSDTFFRFQDILNRGLKHLPMEHDVSVEAFHPEVVSEATPLDHRFTRSPFPTLHVCYHGLRVRDTPLHPKASVKAKAAASAEAAEAAAAAGDGGGSGRRKRDKRKRRS